MDGRMYGRTNGPTEEQSDRLAGRGMAMPTNGQMYGRTDGRTD